MKEPKRRELKQSRKQNHHTIKEKERGEQRTNIKSTEKQGLKWQINKSYQYLT